ncbi:adenosine deaminase [Sinomonas sp. ASV322]|uniref:adenosine deaminase n=1 Tax=Sinomonas sp. ASV322 TaxID=3041920 RepID=UPI0027DE37CD|nr:adenosine deaminase [Sinomonas sp. ASV322]MDQ4502503.1 adenosine deaminase [Sinomonas sp. ASV322]
MAPSLGERSISGLQADRVARIRALPTAELHLHIEGTLEPELAFELAARNGIALPFDSLDDLRSRYEFTDLQSFLDLYYECMAVLRTRDDFRTLGERYVQRAFEQGVRHVEIFFDAQAHTVRGVNAEDVLDGLLDALETGRQRGMSGGLILSFLRDRPVLEAMDTLESLAHRAADLLAVGLDSAEVGYPPQLFVPVFARAKELGLHRVAHAGEEGPAEYVRDALDLLGAERIDHGVRSLEDPELIKRLRDERIPLTVCPFSNVRLAVVPDLTKHPILDLLAAGVLATVNSDDPAYFGGYLADNMAGLAEAFDLGDDVLVRLARNSVEGSFASVERKAELHALIDEWARGGGGELLG